MQTRVLGYFSVTRLDPQRIWVVVKGKCQRVKEAIVGLGNPLSDRIMRKMAVVTDSDIVMARLLPGVVGLLHHVTVDTALGIVAEITGPFAVPERERTQAKHDPQKNRE